MADASAEVQYWVGLGWVELTCSLFASLPVNARTLLSRMRIAGQLALTRHE